MPFPLVVAAAGAIVEYGPGVIAAGEALNEFLEDRNDAAAAAAAGAANTAALEAVGASLEGIAAGLDALGLLVQSAANNAESARVAATESIARGDTAIARTVRIEERLEMAANGLWWYPPTDAGVAAFNAEIVAGTAFPNATGENAHGPFAARVGAFEGHNQTIANPIYWKQWSERWELAASYSALGWKAIMAIIRQLGYYELTGAGVAQYHADKVAGLITGEGLIVYRYDAASLISAPCLNPDLLTFTSPSGEVFSTLEVAIDVLNNPIREVQVSP